MELEKNLDKLITSEEMSSGCYESSGNHSEDLSNSALMANELEELKRIFSSQERLLSDFQGAMEASKSENAKLQNILSDLQEERSRISEIQASGNQSPFVSVFNKNSEDSYNYEEPKKLQRAFTFSQSRKPATNFLIWHVITLSI